MLTKLSHAAAQLQLATKVVAFLFFLSGFQAPIHSKSGDKKYIF